MIKERGNALFLILIAVALFAALAYAVSQSGRGGGQPQKETELLDAARITQYGAQVQSAVQRMILTGTPATSVELCDPGDADHMCSFALGGAFDYNCSTGANCIFAPEGSGVPTMPTVPGTNPVSWILHEEDSAPPLSISGVGTAAPEIAMMTHGGLIGITENLCTAIDKGLGLATPPATISAASFDPIDAYAAAPYQCFKYFGSNAWFYVHTLVER